MGLDMFILKKSKLLDCNEEDVKEIAYFRNFYALQNYIHCKYGNAEYCNKIYLKKEDVTSLLKVLIDIKQNKVDTEKIGFVGGFSSIDDFDDDDILSGIKQFTDILEKTDFEKEEIYYIEWY